MHSVNNSNLPDTPIENKKKKNKFILIGVLRLIAFYNLTAVAKKGTKFTALAFVCPPTLTLVKVRLNIGRWWLRSHKWNSHGLVYSQWERCETKKGAAKCPKQVDFVFASQRDLVFGTEFSIVVDSESRLHFARYKSK